MIDIQSRISPINGYKSIYILLPQLPASNYKSESNFVVPFFTVRAGGIGGGGKRVTTESVVPIRTATSSRKLRNKRPLSKKTETMNWYYSCKISPPEF